ncbi:hypothetical protein BB561_006035 [Smittium simulii]|uniref:Mon2 C-terminal domain-containing protein n=1 Tax=Smittium simulii TaxID=133385 RepID=A0A2T9Y6W0_9FUNG|nr:hypothetical protein BB561_006035 [Smittium simulii]
MSGNIQSIDININSSISQFDTSVDSAANDSHGDTDRRDSQTQAFNLSEFNRAIAAEALLRIITNTKLFLKLYKYYDYQTTNSKIIYSILKDICKYLLERSELFFSSTETTGKNHKKTSDFDYCKKSIGYNDFILTPSDYRNSLSKALISPPINISAQNQLIPLAPSSSSTPKKTLVLLKDAQNLNNLTNSEDKTYATLAKSFMDNLWPELLSSLSFLSKLSFSVSEQILIVLALENFTKVLGSLGIDKGFKSFLTSICNSSLPSLEISKVERNRRSGSASALGSKLPPNTPKSLNSESDKSVKSSSSSEFKAPLSAESLKPSKISLSAMNTQSLTAVSNCACFLSPILNEEWYAVIVTLQQADEILYQSKLSFSHKIEESNSGLIYDKHFSFSKISDTEMQKVFIDHQLLVSEYEFLFKLVPRLNDGDALGWFVQALCLLNLDISDTPPLSRDVAIYTLMRNNCSNNKRITVILNRPSFSIKHLLDLAKSHLDQFLVVKSPSVDNSNRITLWEVFVYQLLDTATYINTLTSLRSQACDALSESVLAAMFYVLDSAKESVIAQSTDPNNQSSVSLYYGDAQIQVLMPLSEMISITKQSRYNSENFSRFTEVQHLALSTLNQLLQTSGHSICKAWDVVFDILQSAVLKFNKNSHSTSHTQSNFSSSSISINKDYSLVRLAFTSLQLICSDFIGNLSCNSIRRCIMVLGDYANQTADLNVALTAIGLMWNITDYLLSNQIDNYHNHEYDNNKSQVLPTPDDLCSSPNKLNQNNTDTATKSNMSQIANLYFNKSKEFNNDSFIELWIFINTCKLEDEHSCDNIELLFLHVLHTLSLLCVDERHELRSSSVKTLFSTLDIYGNQLSTLSWNIIMWAVLQPLLEQVSTSRAKTLLCDWVLPLHKDFLALKLANTKMKYSIFGVNNINLSASVDDDIQNPSNHINLEHLEPSTENALNIDIFDSNSSGIYVEDPRHVRLKTWDETISTTITNIATIFISNSNKVLDTTYLSANNFICYLSWIIAIGSGSISPSDAHNEIYDYFKNSLSKGASCNKTKLDSELINIINKKFIVSEFRPIFQSNVLIETIVGTFKTLVEHLKIHQNVDSVSTDLNSNSNNSCSFSFAEIHGKIIWNFVILLAQFSVEPEEQDEKITSIQIISSKDFLNAGFLQKHYKAIVDFIPPMILYLGPNGLKKLQFGDFQTLFDCLKLLLFSEKYLISRDIYSMTPIQDSIWKTLDSILDMFNIHSNIKTNSESFDCLNTSSNQENVSIGYKSENDSSIELNSDYIPTFYSLLPLYLNFICRLSVLPFLCLSLSDTCAQNMDYKLTVPNWAIEVIESIKQWAHPFDFSYFRKGSSFVEDQPQFNSKSKPRAKPTYLALSQNSLQSINKVITRLDLLCYLNDKSNSCKDNNICLDLMSKRNDILMNHDSSQLSQSSSYDKELVKLTHCLVFKKIILNAIKASSMVLVCWDSFYWDFLVLELNEKFISPLHSYSALRPYWDISADTLLNLINYSFDAFSFFNSFKENDCVIETWSLVNNILKSVVFLPSSVVDKWHNMQFSILKINLESDGNIDFTNSQPMASFNLPPQLSTNYFFENDEFLHRDQNILRCPPPQISDLQSIDPNVVLNKSRSNSLNHKALNNFNIGDKSNISYSTFLNRIMISVLRFISTITDFKKEEAYVDNLYNPSSGHIANKNLSINCSSSHDSETNSFDKKRVNSENSVSELQKTFESKAQQEYSQLMKDLINFVSLVAQICVFSKDSSTLNYVGINIGSISVSEIIQPYKSISILNDKNDLVLTALHWLIVLSSQNSKVISSPLLNSSKSTFNNSSNDILPLSNGTSKDRADNHIRGKNFKDSVATSCFLKNSSLQEYDTVDSVPRFKVCDYGSIPSLKERPRIPLWVGEISSYSLILTSTKLLVDYLGFDSKCFCSYANTEEIGDFNPNAGVFVSNTQIVFLLAHLLDLNIMPNIFGYRIKDKNHEDCTILLEQVLKLAISTDFSNNIGDSDPADIYSGFYEKTISKLGCKYGKNSCGNIFSFLLDEYPNGSFKTILDQNLNLDQAEDDSFNNSDSLTGKNSMPESPKVHQSIRAKISQHLLSSQVSHLYLLFYLIRSLKNDRQGLVRTLARLSATL